jgi:hypothetical protein
MAWKDIFPRWFLTVTLASSPSPSPGSAFATSGLIREAADIVQGVLVNNYSEKAY